jgi:hypothetical protein
MVLSKQQQQMVFWRRDKVLSLVSKGHNQTEIAKILKVNKSIICRDISFLNSHAKQNLNKFVDERLPYEYEKCITGINEILKLAWAETSERDIERREKMQALSLAKECYIIKLDLLTNASILNDAMKFVASHQHQKHQQQNQEGQQQQQHDNNNQEQEEEENNDDDSNNNNDDNEAEELMATADTTINDQIF